MTTNELPDDHSFRFRLWRPDQVDQPDDSPTLNWTLRGLVEDWFLAQRDKQAAEGTKRLRFDLLQWWEKLTNNPPIGSITDETIEAFAEALSKATYCRSKFGNGRQIPLSVYSQRKLLANLRTLLNAIGPQRSRKKRTLHLLSDPPMVDLPAEEDGEPKHPFSLRTARRMYEHCIEIHWPKVTKRTPYPPTFACSDYLQATLSVWYYLGFREGTCDKLRWAMLEFRRGSWWIRVPREEVEKTSKGRFKFVHPDLYAALDKIRTSDPRLLPCPFSKEWRDNAHARLQRLAGVAEEDLLSPHAWRRTHAHAVEHVGRRKLGEVLAQLALDHSDAKTTRRNYLANEHKVLRRLPRLARKRKPVSSDRQLTLFA